MKKNATPPPARNLDKFLFEAGQQCQKRLWLDYHEPVDDEPSLVRQTMSAAGTQLRQLARTAFPKGVVVESSDIAKAAAETKERLAAATPVLFDAAFLADGVEVRCDILVVHRDNQCDLFEVKSGVKIKHRYVNDLALQAHVLGANGLTLRAAYLLHVSPKYVHKEGAEFPAMQLLRSADVTAKVMKQLEPVRRRLQQYKATLADRGALALPMGTFCENPFPCPHLARCKKEAPKLPLRELPELTRQQEVELHKEGIEDLSGLDAARPGLTFRQRRTLACVQQDTPIVEPFVREELRQCGKPLHFLAIAAITDPLPRFDGQRAWRRVPYAWAVRTVHEDGRLETASFAHADRTDPRPGFATSLGKHLEVGGTIVVWDDDALENLEALLDDLPAQKAAVRAIVGRQHLDLMQLFDNGVFHPQVRDHRDLRASVKALLGDDSGKDIGVFGEAEVLAALQKAWTPRARATTKDKIAAEILAGLTWAVERIHALFLAHGEIQVEPPKPKVEKPRAAAKALPKPLPDQP